MGAKKAALTQDEAAFWDFSVQSAAGTRAKFKARLIYALDGRDGEAPCWSEIRLFKRTRAAGGYVLAVSAMREGLGLENLHVAVPVETLEEALDALERVDVAADARFGAARKAESAIAAIAQRGRLYAYALDHARLTERALSEIAVLGED